MVYKKEEDFEASILAYFHSVSNSTILRARRRKLRVLRTDKEQARVFCSDMNAIVM